MFECIVFIILVYMFFISKFFVCFCSCNLAYQISTNLLWYTQYFLTFRFLHPFIIIMFSRYGFNEIATLLIQLYDQNFISEYYLIKYILLILSITPHLKSLIAATMECEICVQVYILCNHTCLHLLQKRHIQKTFQTNSMVCIKL